MAMNSEEIFRKHFNWTNEEILAKEKKLSKFYFKNEEKCLKRVEFFKKEF